MQIVAKVERKRILTVVGLGRNQDFRGRLALRTIRSIS